MRYAAACILASLLGAAGVYASPKPDAPSVTILFGFDGRYSEKSVKEMKREMASIMRDSGVRIDWKESSTVTPAESFPNLVIVKFRGTCRMDPVPFLYDERGPLAFTYSTDGTVLPFSEVACDKVRSSLNRAMWGGDYRRSDTLLGRALARVLAHELYHMLAKTPAHGENGVAKRALSGSELISDKLRLDAAELKRIREASGVQDSSH